jgi:hypothetical protein
VPRAGREKEVRAVDIVCTRLSSRGWQVDPPLAQIRQPVEGCDFFATSPGGDRHAIEVKGWGEPLLGPSGRFLHAADINAEQLRRAKDDERWRLEIVGNLDAVIAGRGAAQCLSLTGEEVAQRAEGWKYRVPLDDFADRVVETQ